MSLELLGLKLKFGETTSRKTEEESTKTGLRRGSSARYRNDESAVKMLSGRVIRTKTVISI